MLIQACKDRQGKIHDQASDTLDITKAVLSDSTTPPFFQYSLAEKLQFLDSVSKLNLQSLKDSTTFDEDSTFQRRKNFAITLTIEDFEKLKYACKKGRMSIETAKRLFPNFDDSTLIIAEEENRIIIHHIPLSNKNDNFDEFAVSLGSSDWSNLVYFFKKNQLIAFHDIYHRYGLEIKHFTGADGNTTIYYKQNFASGSGIWQFNYYFYKYMGNKLIPVLNILENGNYTWPGPRTYWLETFVQSENPLKLKFVYNFLFKDSLGSELLNDSTEVIYNYDQNLRAYIGHYKDSKINADKILTYYLGDNELLFINAYNQELKAWIDGKDKIKRERTLNYLNKVMNYTTTYR